MYPGGRLAGSWGTVKFRPGMMLEFNILCGGTSSLLRLALGTDRAALCFLHGPGRKRETFCLWKLESQEFNRCYEELRMVREGQGKMHGSVTTAIWSTRRSRPPGHMKSASPWPELHSMSSKCCLRI